MNPKGFQDIFTRKKVMTVFYLGLLVLAGIYVRIVDLSTHFAHCDDLGVAKMLTVYQSKFPFTVEEMIRRVYETPTDTGSFCLYSLGWIIHRLGGMPVLVAMCNWFFQVLALPRYWTYAPLQFFLTYFLISGQQDYRTLLFWGRFPSFLFGVLGLLSMILFYKKYDRLKTPAVFVSLTLLTFSWENIIYAKQMESYTIGVFAAIWILILLDSQLRARDLSFKTLLGIVLALAVLSHTQYQVLFFVPAFFLTLILYFLSRVGKKGYKILVKLFIGGLVYSLFIFPMYYWFLRQHQGGVMWNAGPHQEFVLAFQKGLPFFEKAVEALIFFGKNFFIVLNAMVSFIPEEHRWYGPMGILFVSLFVLGVVSFWQSRILRKKMIGSFFVFVSLTWVVFICQGKMALSPTRHNLILLPFAGILLAEGWVWGVHWLTKMGLPRRIVRAGHAMCLGWVVLLFFLSFRTVVAQRRDPFDEPEIRRVLEKYHVDTVIATDFTWNLSFMPWLPQNYNYFEEHYMLHPYQDRVVPPYQSIAFISHRKRLSKEVFERMKNQINAYHVFRSESRDALLRRMFTNGFTDYRLVYSKEAESDVEIDFSKRTKNGSNNLFFYVLQRT
ncbi:MAG: hypothetical protein NC930_07715 [Candidatus Omnitrophica bacterium]|nr:hypothetical protein [Candidatus Omnitrophota bacterium]